MRFASVTHFLLETSGFIVVKRKIFFCSQDIELKVEVWLKDLHWRRAVWEALGGFGEAWGGFGSFWAIFGLPSDTLSQK